VQEQEQEQNSGSLREHELCSALRGAGCSLNATLVEMLGEHYSHRTERRGCGFTQATRHLAALVNRPRNARLEATAKLFPEWARAAISSMQVENSCSSEANEPERELSSLHAVVRSLPARLEREESQLLAAIIADLVLPEPEAEERSALPACFDELKVGTCPLAEKYFLEIAQRHVRRKGRVNVLVSEGGEPLLIEKLGLGDDHSCTSLTELSLNGVRLPAGCLFAVKREVGVELRAGAKLPGSVIRLKDCQGFRFLRLTTLAVSPVNRRRAFTAHFQAQIDAGLFAPGETTVEQLRRVAEEQL